MADSLEPWHQVLRQDFSQWRQEHLDYEALKQYSVSVTAVNQLKEMTVGEFRFRDEPVGLYVFHGVVQDTQSPEYYTAFYMSSGEVCSHKYGCEGVGDAVEDQLLPRTPYQCLPIPGYITTEPMLKTAQVIIYDETQVKIQSRLDGLGLWDGEALHFIVSLEPERGEMVDRSEVAHGIEVTLGGDKLAAEYVLLSLLSCIEKPDTQVGRLVVNISQVTASAELISVLQQLCPTLLLPLSLQFLNHTSLTPTKNYDTDRIDPSPLQVCDGTVLILDETVLEPGTLTEKGVANFRFLSNLMQSQQLNYDFTYHQLPIPMRISCISLSRGKSILPFDVTCPLIPTQTPTFSQISTNLHASIANLRGVSVNLPSEMQEEITKTFVQKRKETQVSVEDLHLWLNLSQLIAKSHNRTEVTKTDWVQALSMEENRKSRLNS